MGHTFFKRVYKLFRYCGPNIKPFQIIPSLFSTDTVKGHVDERNRQNIKRYLVHRVFRNSLSIHCFLRIEAYQRQHRFRVNLKVKRLDSVTGECEHPQTTDRHCAPSSTA